MADLGTLEWIKLAIYYVSYLYFVAAPIAMWGAFHFSGARRIGAFLFLLVISLLAYGRFVEPRLLVTNEHTITLKQCYTEAGSFRTAVFSDTHNGLFGNAMPIDRIVTAVNKTTPDFVLIPGDFVYFLNSGRFENTFQDLAQINAPVFAVLGNHDIGLPGPNVAEPLNVTLSQSRVRLIDNTPLVLSNSHFDIELTGLSDQWARKQELSLLTPEPDKPRIVLTHNPATMRDISKDMHLDFLVGGHTHGGQIQLPFITCWWTGVCGDIAYGLREEKGVQIFTTSGTGMVGLPMRFRVPPRIDVLNVRYHKCAA